MNVFFLDYDPEKSARYHSDKHVVKQVLEYTQILSNACRHFGLDVGYRPTLVNQPASRWAYESWGNYNYLWHLTYYLFREFEQRYRKVHSWKTLFKSLPTPAEMRQFYRQKELTPPPQLFKGHNKYRQQDPVKAYRAFYRGTKRYQKNGKTLAVWKHSPEPEWWAE